MRRTTPSSPDQLSFEFGASPAQTPPAPASEPAPPEREEWVPADQPARDRILTELDANLLVEAGAGSGKTTAMVGRMVALVRAGREVERLAAVTFTRKAAAELRERFQEALEGAYRQAVASGDEEARSRYGAALDRIDRCFLGTIHAFCARLLRERPLEAGVPPDFEEVFGAAEERLRGESWTRFLERLSAREPSHLLRGLAEVGLRPAQLRQAFIELAENPDVRFPAPPASRPDPREVADVRRSLERLLDDSQRLLPGTPHPSGWDDLQRKVRSLRFSRYVLGWDSEVAFFEALDEAVQGSNHVVQYRWQHGGALGTDAKELGHTWEEFGAEGSRARRLLAAWWALRYRTAIRFARAAAASYAEDRIRLGRLTFGDLLVRTAALLRESPEARRELGEQYRWLLVDEFQDTDPLQAEILFLLSSQPDQRGAWNRLVPRPGALFVVGDPKQSIYRFRRADIAVYNQVKAAFRGFGSIVELTTNFRSTRPIERFVNRAFEGPLPNRETEHQAAFSPLRVRPRDPMIGGVRWYSFSPAAGRGKFMGRRIHEPEAPLLASWVRERTQGPGADRKPGDFLVLTHTKHVLAAYAAALEAQAIPVQVTGAGVVAEEELRQLVLLLRALADPGDPVLTLAVLEGLFFGLSHEELFAHAAAGGRFSFLSPGVDEGPAAAALETLREFWRLGRSLPADVAVARIVDRLGLLPFAAAEELGGTRAGAIVYVLDALRVAARDSALSLTEAVEVLETALEQEAEAPLVPGEVDAVRLMNLHKAKGLEAPVVVLAYPAKAEPHPATRHIARDAGGDARGWLRIGTGNRRSERTIAAPADWPLHEAAELPYELAEDVRLLYVAATRAAEELVIARCDRTEDDSNWAPLLGALEVPGLATPIDIEPALPRPREPLEDPPAEIEARIAAAECARERLASESYRVMPVTQRVHGDGAGRVQGSASGTSDSGDSPRVEVVYLGRLRPSDEPPLEARGTEWGSAVHRALEAALRGVSGDLLRNLCRVTLIEFERPIDPATGEPQELEELLGMVEAVRGSAVWERVRQARRVLVEAPVSFAVDAAEAAGLGVEDPAETEVFEGVIDLALQDERGEWTILDFKTDAWEAPERDRAYQAQLRLYAEALTRIGSR